MIEAKDIDKEMVDNLLHRINVMCISEILKEEEDFSNYIDCLQMVCKPFAIPHDTKIFP